jgi:hypothetical protein
MADTADVRQAIAALIEAAVYPNGTSSPTAIAGVTGLVAVYPSDIKPRDIDIRLARGDLLVGIMEWGDGRSTKRFPVRNDTINTPAPTLGWQINAAGTSATLFGTVTVPQNIALIIDGAPYVYSVQTGDTLTAAVAALAALIPDCGVSGPTISLLGIHSLIGRVGVVSSTLREVGRQLSRYVVSVWSATDAIRANAARLIRGALDDQRRVLLSDGSAAWIGQAYEMPVYDPKKLGISRSNICYAVEYASTVAGTAPTAIAIGATLGGTPAPIPGPGSLLGDAGGDDLGDPDGFLLGIDPGPPTPSISYQAALVPVVNAPKPPPSVLVDAQGNALVGPDGFRLGI